MFHALLFSIDWQYNTAPAKHSRQNKYLNWHDMTHYERTTNFGHSSRSARNTSCLKFEPQILTEIAYAWRANYKILHFKHLCSITYTTLIYKPNNGGFI